MLQLYATVLLITKQDGTHTFLDEGWRYGLNTNRTRWEYADLSSNTYFGAVMVVIWEMTKHVCKHVQYPSDFFQSHPQNHGTVHRPGCGVNGVTAESVTSASVVLLPFPRTDDSAADRGEVTVGLNPTGKKMRSNLFRDYLTFSRYIFVQIDWSLKDLIFFFLTFCIVFAGGKGHHGCHFLHKWSFKFKKILFVRLYCKWDNNLFVLWLTCCSIVNAMLYFTSLFVLVGRWQVWSL